ncbi:hypothetical protein CTI12_AA525590 [Artemisia annua]|uniref:Fungal lipase-type domain-containing protein n=1 Tax=Artemisia annua TaxID=35608 RepID=A0A2U1L5X2_ARTAN|nr:hypothetical protein CTI12_AA525590 [Artemisia annua]
MIQESDSLQLHQMLRIPLTVITYYQKNPVSTSCYFGGATVTTTNPNLRWKDLRTDLMLSPTGLNPERIGGDFKEEIQYTIAYPYDVCCSEVHLGKFMILDGQGYCIHGDDDADPVSKWHVFVTGHSLGGAPATLLALELSSSQLAKSNANQITRFDKLPNQSVTCSFHTRMTFKIIYITKIHIRNITNIAYMAKENNSLAANFLMLVVLLSQIQVERRIGFARVVYSTTPQS